MSGRAAYRRKPFRAVCRSCETAEWREDRQDALEFAEQHRAGHVVLSPAENVGADP